MTPIISASILSADWGRLKEELDLLKEAGVDWIHVDVMDGHFVPNITFGPKFVETLKRLTDLPLDVHLMIENPEKYTHDFIKAGADILTVHAESTHHLQRLLVGIKEKGARAGVALNPSTPVSALECIINDLDLILVMSVNPGFGGQKFIPQTLEKLKQITWNKTISVDGGINDQTFESVLACGANVLVVGSYLFYDGDYKSKIKKLHSPPI